VDGGTASVGCRSIRTPQLALQDANQLLLVNGAGLEARKVVPIAGGDLIEVLLGADELVTWWPFPPCTFPALVITFAMLNHYWGDSRRFTSSCHSGPFAPTRISVSSESNSSFHLPPSTHPWLWHQQIATHFFCMFVFLQPPVCKDHDLMEKYFDCQIVNIWESLQYRCVLGLSGANTRKQSIFQ